MFTSKTVLSSSKVARCQQGRKWQNTVGVSESRHTVYASTKQPVQPPHLNDLLHNLWVNVTHASTRGRALTPIQQQLCCLCRQLLLLLLLLGLRFQLLLRGLAVGRDRKRHAWHISGHIICSVRSVLVTRCCTAYLGLWAGIFATRNATDTCDTNTHSMPHTRCFVVVLPHLKNGLKVVCDHSGALQLSHWLALQYRTHEHTAVAAVAVAVALFRHVVD